MPDQPYSQPSPPVPASRAGRQETGTFNRQAQFRRLNAGAVEKKSAWAFAREEGRVPFSHVKRSGERSPICLQRFSCLPDTAAAEVHRRQAPNAFPPAATEAPPSAPARAAPKPPPAPVPSVTPVADPPPPRTRSSMPVGSSSGVQ